MTSSRSAAAALRAGCPRARWSGVEGRCQWCDVSLLGVKRRRTWCSDRCLALFEAHHVWSHAKPTALARAGGRCEQAGCATPADRPLVIHLSGDGQFAMSCDHHQDNLLVLCRAHRKARIGR